MDFPIGIKLPAIAEIEIEIEMGLKYEYEMGVSPKHTEVCFSFQFAL